MDDDAVYAMLKERKSKKIPRKKREGKSAGKGMSEDEKREAIRAGLVRKKGCEKRALDIVERMIETGVDKEWLRDSCPMINTNHYQDATEERAVSGLCGYPLCDASIDASVRDTTQKYRISTKENKVYDITERKNFCSNDCCKRSNFLKEQVATSPLWLRERDDGGGDRPDPPKFYDEADCDGSRIFVSGKGVEVELKLPFVSKPNDEVVSEEADQSDEGDQVESLQEKLGTMSFKPRKRTEKISEDARDPLEKVLSSMRSWYTIDTMRFVRGDDHVRGALRESGVSAANVVTVVGDDTFGSGDLRAKYVQLCRKLEMRDSLEEGEDPGEFVEPQQHLRQETGVENLKLGAFLSGRTDYDESKVEIVEKQNESDDPRPCVPLVDKHAQGALRRRIVHDQLDRVFPSLLDLAGLRKRDFSDILRRLVLTLSLDADSIVLRPGEWTLAAVILLVMISKVDEPVRKALNEAKSAKYMNLTLMGYGANASLGFVERFIDDLSGDIKGLIAKMKVAQH